MAGKKKMTSKIPVGARSQYTSSRAKTTKTLLASLPNRSSVRPRIK